jgi:hypothetical protein
MGWSPFVATPASSRTLKLFMEKRDHKPQQQSSLKPDKDREEVTEMVDQDPGERQKENQNRSKDDPLAA